MLKLIALLVLGLAWLVPNHYPPWNSFYNDSVAGLALAMLVVACAKSFERIPRATWVLLAVALIPPAQLLLGRLVFSSDSALGFLYVSALAIAIATGFAWSQSGLHSAMAMLCRTVLVSSLISLLIAMEQALRLDGLGIWALDSYGGMRPYANLGQPNNLATLFGMAIVSTCYLVETRAMARTLGLVAAMALIIGMAITQSRTALFFGPAILACVAWGRRLDLKLTIGRAFICVATVFHWLLTLAWPAIQRLFVDDATITLGERSVSSVRFLVWPVLLDALNHAPLVGYGWLQVAAAELAVVNRHAPVGELWLHGHNLFLELMLWCGYPIGLALSLMIVWWLFSRARRIQSTQGLAALTAIIVFGIHAMLELPHHYAYLLIPIGLFAGMLERDVSGSTLASGRLIWVPIGVNAVLMLAIWQAYPAVEEDFRTMRFDSLKIGPDRSTRAIPDSLVLSSLTGYLHAVNVKPAPGLTALQLSAMDDVTKHYPYPGMLYKMALSYAMNGQPALATSRFEAVRHIYGQVKYEELRKKLLDESADPSSALYIWASSLAR